MISERRFAQRSASVWRLIAPAMDIFVRKVNLELYERDDVPMDVQTIAHRRGFVNELAFSLFVSAMSRNAPNTPKSIAEAIAQTQKTIGRIEGLEPQAIEAPSDLELEDATEQNNRLRRFFKSRHPAASIEPRPRFNGCGIVDACVGDIYVDGWLYEVKAGDRNFRSPDFRQLLLYATLNWEAKSRPLEGVGLVNPRIGVSFRTTLDALSLEISGRPSSDLMAEIVHIISSGDTSR